MTVLDVGCNLGYMSFALANHFSRVVGIEEDELIHDICQEIKSQIKSPAEFQRLHFFEKYNILQDSFDICLLFSVIHYLVAAQGVDKSKAILADIVSHFDYVLIELSSKVDYPYMPETPEEMLAGLQNVSITKLGESEKNKRPLYLLKRLAIDFPSKGTLIDQTYYAAPHKGDSCTRVHFSNDYAIKELPLPSYPMNLQKFHNEVSAYRILQGVDYVPTLISSRHDKRAAWICTKKIKGSFLNCTYSRRPFLSTEGKETLLCQLLLIQADMLNRGLYWNDLSAHNIVIATDGLRIIDFGESGRTELHDHLSMLSWLMHDIQLNQWASYDSGVYQRIHDAGTNVSKSIETRFKPSPGFFDAQLEWIFEGVATCPSFAEYLNFDERRLLRIKQVAGRPIVLA
jgi:hypothetical protein